MKNILLISWDSVRADQLPMYGYDRNTTPKLNQWADDGLVFDDCYVSGVGTPTSFSGVFTGEYAHGVQTNISPTHWREANSNRRFLSEAMQDAGYYTGAVHANALMSEYYGWNRGWDVFEDRLWTTKPTNNADMMYAVNLENSSDYWTKIKKTKLLPWLRQHGMSAVAVNMKNIIFHSEAYAPWESLWPDIETFIRTAPEPWFLWILLVDTHHPWHAPSEYQEWPQYGFRRTHLWNYIMRRWPNFTGVRKPEIVNAYDNELRHADAFLIRLEALLDETKNADSPILVHSDHGDELGEHEDYGHAPAMWDTVTKVPLIMKNVGATGRVNGPHTLLDIGSTILELAGSDERLNDRPTLFDADHDSVYIENRRMDGRSIRAVVYRGWKYIEHPDRGNEIYKLPDNEISDDIDYPEEIFDVFDELRRSDPIEMDLKVELDPDLEEQLTNLGYI